MKFLKTRKEGSKISDLILKPDEVEYEFDKYFSYDDIDGILEPKGEEDSIEYLRAKDTINKLKLNEKGLPEARKQISDNKSTFQSQNTEKLPYRFVLSYL